MGQFTRFPPENTASVIGTVAVSNFPPVQAVSQSGTWNVGVTGTVVISNFPTTVDTNYGVVGANTIRTASEIGNATGAADFNSGATTAQTLRVVLPTDQAAIPVTQAGTWSTGRTWTLSSGTDSVSAVQSGTWTVQQGGAPWSVSQSGTWNINDISGTISLPTGASTSALQTAGNASLANIDTNLAKLTQTQGSTTSGQSGPLVQGAVTTAAPSYTTGQTSPISLTTTGLLRVDASGSTIPISGTVTANQGTSPWVVSGTVAATQSGAWTTGRTWSLSNSTDSVAAVQSGTWTVQQGTPPWSVSQSGTWNINNISGTISLPTGASTSANQATEIASLASIDGHIDVNLSTRASEATLSLLNGKVTDDYGASSAAIRTASQIGNTTGAALFGAGTTTAQVLRVVLPTDQTAIPVSQSGTWSAGRTWTLSSGTDSVSAVQSGTWNINNISGTVSLPTGAATSALQTSGNASLTSIDGKLPATLGQKTMANSFAVVLASDQTAIPVSQSGTWTTGRTWTLASGTDSVAAVQSGTWNINNISGTVSLPTGASTSALQTTGNSSLSSIDGKLVDDFGVSTAALRTAAQVGNATGAASFNAGTTTAQTLRVVLPTDQTSIPVAQSGTWTTGRTWALSSGTDSVAAVQSGTWNINNVSGTVSLPTGASTSALQTTGNTSLSSIDGKLADNYGVATAALRTAAQIGNTTGAADFNAGTTGAQTLRVVLPTDQTGINTFLDKAGSGTITALNGAVTITTNGCSTITFSITGTWVATILFEAQSGDGTWTTMLGSVVGQDNVTNFLQANAQLQFAVGGYSQVRVRASAFTSGTITVTYNVSMGVNNVHATNLNALAFKTSIADSLGNGLTSSSEIGSAATKQPLDVHEIPTATSYYSFPFAIRQSAATAANSSVLSMRNAAASTRTVFIENMTINMDFNAATPVTRTLQTYVFQRFTTATPTGGTALTAGKRDSADAASQVTDIRFLDTGLTTAGVVFDTNSITGIACPTFGTFGQFMDEGNVAIKLLPGEGLIVRLGVVAVVGQEISGIIRWSER